MLLIREILMTQTNTTEKIINTLAVEAPDKNESK